MRVTILNLQPVTVDRALVRRAARHAARRADHQHTSVGIALVDDERITELNRAHLGRERATDVLAYQGDDDDDPGYLGDVAIGVETAARQAGEAGRALDHEVAWLAAHGVLHLLGYDDADADARQAMMVLQDQALEAALVGR